MRIAISSKSGCGNTTVSTLLSEKLGYPMVNFTFRQMAQERGVDFWTFCRMAEDDYDIDRELDRRQVEMAMEQKDCILASRLAIWMLKEAALKVYLYASDEVRANRVFTREGGDLKQIKEFTAMRDSEDSRRYKKLYNIDNNAYSFADVIIDTSKYTPEQIVRQILDELKMRGFISE